MESVESSESDVLRTHQPSHPAWKLHRLVPKDYKPVVVGMLICLLLVRFVANKKWRKWKQRLSTKEVEMVVLEKMETEVQKHIAALEMKLLQAKTKQINLEQETESQHKVVEEREKELERTSAICDGLVGELASEKADLEAVRNETTQLRQKVQAQREQNIALNVEYDEAIQIEAHVRAQLNAASEELAAMSKSVEEVEAYKEETRVLMQEQKEQQASFHAEAEHVRQRRLAAEEEVAKSRMALEEVIAVCRDVAGQLTDEQQQLQAHIDERKQVHQHAESVQKETSQLEEKVRKHWDLQAVLNGEYNKSNLDVVNVRQKMRRAEEQISQAAKSLKDVLSTSGRLPFSSMSEETPSHAEILAVCKKVAELLSTEKERLQSLLDEQGEVRQNLETVQNETNQLRQLVQEQGEQNNILNAALHALTVCAESTEAAYLSQKVGMEAAESVEAADMSQQASEEAADYHSKNIESEDGHPAVHMLNSAFATHGTSLQEEEEAEKAPAKFAVEDRGPFKAPAEKAPANFAEEEPDKAPEEAPEEFHFNGYNF